MAKFILDKQLRNIGNVLERFVEKELAKHNLMHTMLLFLYKE